MLRIFAFAISVFLSYAASGAGVTIDIDLDLTLDPITYQSNGYEVESILDDGIQSISRVSYLNQIGNLTAHTVLSDQALSFYGFSDVVWSSHIDAEGRISFKQYPELEAPFESMDARVLTPTDSALYVLDEIQNTIFKLAVGSESWLDLRTELTIPEGEIVGFQEVANHLYVIVNASEMFEVWEVSPSMNLIFKSKDPISWLTMGEGLIAYNDGWSRGSSAQSNTPYIAFLDSDEIIQFKDGASIRLHFLPDGILVSESNTEESAFSNLYWLEYSQRMLTVVKHPTGVTQELWCISNRPSVICQYESDADYVYYSFEAGKLKLDSVVSKDHFDGAEHIRLMGFVGESRIFAYVAGDQRKHVLLTRESEIEVFSVNSLESTPLPPLVDAQNKQIYIFEHTGQISKLAKIELTQSSLLTPLVQPDEHSQYREFKGDHIEESEDEGVGRVGALFFVFLVFAARRKNKAFML